jgi:hypothetical protein
VLVRRKNGIEKKKEKQNKTTKNNNCIRIPSQKNGGTFHSYQHSGHRPVGIRKTCNLKAIRWNQDAPENEPDTDRRNAPK